MSSRKFDPSAFIVARRVLRTCSIFVLLALVPLVLACGSEGRKAALPTAAASASTKAPAAEALAAQAPESGESPIMTASTEAHRRSVLVSPVSGIVSRVLVREGTFVRKGTRLVELEQLDFILRIRAAEAGVQAAQAQVDGLAAAHARIQSLRGTDSVPQSEFDTVDAQFKAAKAALRQAEAGRDMAKKAQRDSEIFAPYDGLVTKRMINEGEYAANMPPQPLVVLEETNPLDLRVLAPAARAGHIVEGTPLLVSFPALGKEVRATVTKITPWVDPRNRTFAVIAELPNADNALMPGLYAEARLADSPAEASR